MVVNPVDWAELRLVKDTTENYVAGSPFSNGPAQPGELLFGRRVVVTQAIEAGLALVGAFGTGAQLYRRGGLTVEASNSHEDFFRRDLVAIRAETRLALAVHRPAAFATADFGLPIAVMIAFVTVSLTAARGGATHFHLVRRRYRRGHARRRSPACPVRWRRAQRARSADEAG